MESRDIWRIPGLELGQQSNLLLDVSDLFVMLVQVEGFNGNNGVGRGVDSLEDAAERPFADEVDDGVRNRGGDEGVFVETGFFGLCAGGQYPPLTGGENGFGDVRSRTCVPLSVRGVAIVAALSCGDSVFVSFVVGVVVECWLSARAGC